MATLSKARENLKIAQPYTPTVSTPQTPEANTNATIDFTKNEVPKIAVSEEGALEEIQTEGFYKTLKSYYSYRENDKKYQNMSHADLLEFFYTDRSFRTNNTIWMGMDMSNVVGEEDENRLKEFAYISQTYENLPSFWNDPNRNFGSWLLDNGRAMVADPVNLVGAGVGGVAAKSAYKQALRVTLKNKIAGELTERTLKQTAEQASKAALGKAVVKGGLVEGAINGVIASGQDALLQNINIQSGVQDKYEKGRGAIVTAAGFGFGTVFGAAFAAGSFKLTNAIMRRKAVKHLKEIQDKGQSNVTGARLFDTLLPDETTKSLRNNPSPKSTKEYLNKLESDIINPDDKPPKLIINATKQKKGGFEGLVKYTIEETTDLIKRKKITHAEMIDRAVIKFGADREKLQAMSDDMANSEAFVEAYATIVGQGDMIRSKFDFMGAIGTESNGGNLSPVDEDLMITKFFNTANELNQDIQIKAKGGTNIGRALSAHNAEADGTRAAQLIANPEDPKMKAMFNGTREQKLEFINLVGKLSDRDQIIRALQKARDVDSLDIANEFVNNNLLSSPDTHILNIVSGLVQTQWKPATLFLRGANMTLRDSARAKVIMREALQTYVYQYVYLGHAMKRAAKSLYEGRAILDSRQMKHDANVRQGQLQDLFDAWGEALTDVVGLEGTKMGKAITGTFKGTGRVLSAPMRVLAGGDEFLKSMMFKARMTSLINSRILKENPEFSVWKDTKHSLTDITYAEKYNQRARQIEAEYINAKTGAAVEIDKTVDAQLNAPLHAARELSYTNAVSEIDPNTKELEGKVTGKVLGFVNKHKWARLLGLHFVNTPSNLLRWNAQHLPFLGRFQFQMQHMLAEKAMPNGKFRSEIARGLNPFRKKEYLNPEAAAEAKARIQMGYALWGVAINFALAGKVTGGGDVDWKKNKDKEHTTGWQQYSWKLSSGKYISMNRLDPLFFPMFVAADFVALIKKHTKNSDDIDPAVQKQTDELVLGIVATITRNLTSKFYTKNILEIVNLLTSDDFMNNNKKPSRVGGQMLSQFAFKAVPLSGGLRYVDRVNDEWERELYTLSDRLKTLIPLDSKTAIMPKRNMFGEKIDRKNGWLFGLGGEAGLWSSPFATTQFKNDATAKFIREREFKYRHPSATLRVRGDSQGMELKTIRNSKNQTAYDRMLEIKSETMITHNGLIIFDKKGYTGKQYSLNQFVEKMVTDFYNQKGVMYRHPNGTINGKDEQAQIIIDFINRIDRYSKKQMMKEFPEFKEREKALRENKSNKYNKHFKALKTLAE